MLQIEGTAEQLRQQLLQRRSALREELDRVEAALEAVTSLQGVGSVALPGDDWSDLGIVEAAKRLLEESGRMSTRQLADEMLRRGVKTKAKRFIATVYVVLRDSKHFHFDKKTETWSLAKQPAEVVPMKGKK